MNGSPEVRRDARDREDLRIGALGSGSDYSSFIDHLGVASLNFGYGGEDDGGIYHSIYDDFYWFMHFSDSAFVYERALARRQESQYCVLQTQISSRSRSRISLRPSRATSRIS